MNQRTFHPTPHSLNPQLRSNAVFFPLLSCSILFRLQKAEIIACEKMFAPCWLSKKGTKGWWKKSNERRETKVHFVIFCNCAQFLMKAAKVHCCAQHNEMAAWMWKFMMKIKSPTSTFLTLLSPFSYPFISLRLYLLPFHFSSRSCIKYRKLLKST